MAKKDKKDKQGCPRGFKWCPMKKECVPDRTEVADKLMVKAERYFFKEGVLTESEVDELVDEVFAGGFAHFGKVRKAEKKIDRLLDAVNINTTGRPYDHPIKMKVVSTPDGDVEVNVADNVGATSRPKGDIGECSGPLMGEGDNFEGSEYDGGEQAAKEDDPKKLSNKINTVPNQNVDGLRKSLHAELGESIIWKMIAEARKDPAYKAYFQKALNKHGYKSPADIPPAKKANFFNAIDKGWTAAHEQIQRNKDEEEDVDEYIERPKPDRPKGGFGSIGGTKTSGGFGTIKGR